VAFIDDWARPGEETCEEELLGDDRRLETPIKNGGIYLPGIYHDFTYENADFRQFTYEKR
jgi:hypothetical protein